MRLNKPIGILLLWYPTAWALWLANSGAPSLRLGLLFFLGTVIMRSAGCVINDIADRNIDIHVARTKERPLTSGMVPLVDAYVLVFILLSLALSILIQLPRACFYWALVALAITIIYPFCKRFINMPQTVLGLAFSMGIPMVYIASDSPMNSEFYVLCLLNFFWIVAYDTMYAMTDKEDDLKIGVKSTAVYFAQYDRLVIGALQLCMHLLWILWGVQTKKGTLVFYCLWAIAGLVLVQQQKLIHNRVPKECFKAFLISAYYGAIMWLAVM
jgi:4-hydroxybenzoate polyprenyltransferase